MGTQINLITTILYYYPLYVYSFHFIITFLHLNLQAKVKNTYI